MQLLLQKAKRLISICLITFLAVTSALTILPAPATALGDLNVHDNDLAVIKCVPDSNCGSMAAFAAGVAEGSVVTLIATGHTATLAVIGSAATATATGAIASAGAAIGSLVAAPVLVPAAATAAVGYIGYKQWEASQHSHTR